MDMVTRADASETSILTGLTEEEIKVYCSDFSVVRKGLFSRLPETVMNKRSAQVLEIDALFDAVNYTITSTGAGVLYRSLVCPHDSLEAILSKQNAVEELSRNGSLRENVENMLQTFKSIEKNFFNYMEHPREGATMLNIYTRFHATRKAAQMWNKLASNLPSAESTYLNYLFSELKNFKATRMGKMLLHHVYKKNNEMVPRDELPFIRSPGSRFYPTFFSPVVISTGAMAFTLHHVAQQHNPSLNTTSIAEINGLETLVMFSPFWVMIIGMGKLISDLIHYLEPFSDAMKTEQGFHRSMDAIGELDTLLSFVKYKEVMQIGASMTMPKVFEADHHYFSVQGACNPILAKNTPLFVSNDVYLSGQRITFLSGPNSGGKTTICKTIGQIQILAQAGCYVPAKSAEISVADMIGYQAPLFDGLKDEEGRYGTELLQLRDLFYRSTPKSLLILDELVEGTTAEEKIEQSMNILDGLWYIRGNTILASHNHALADLLAKKGRGRYWQVTFDDERPTYTLSEGISRVSKADRVARKLGFSREDIEQHLCYKGYLKPDEHMD